MQVWEAWVLGITRKKYAFVASNCVLGTAEQLMLPIYDILLEPAWPSVVADHHPEDWPGSVAPAPYHQDLIYLSNEKALSKWVCASLPQLLFLHFHSGMPRL